MKKLQTYESAIIVFSAIILVFIGLVEIWSASSYFFFRHFNNSNYLLKRDLFYIIFSGFICYFVYRLNLRLIRISIPILIILALLSLLALHFGFGTNVRGAVRWIDFGFFTFEPTELARFVFILYLADFIDRKYESLQNFNILLPLLVVFALFIILIISQPDIGGALLMSLAFLAVLYIFGIKFIYIFSLIIPAFVLFLYFFILHPERLHRIVNFLHHSNLPYQVHQGFIALAGGGLFGRGIGNGSFKSLFLPDAYNDFIIASIGEDLGFLGVLLVVILLFLLVYAIFSIATKTQSLFEKALVSGIGFLLSIQILINLGSVFYLMPTKGTVLPFVSHGGTNLVINAIMIGIVLNIAKKL